MPPKKGCKAKWSNHERDRAARIAVKYGLKPSLVEDILKAESKLIYDSLLAEEKVYLYGIGTISLEKHRFPRKYNAAKRQFDPEMLGLYPTFTPNRTLYTKIWQHKVKMPLQLRRIWRSDPRKLSELMLEVA